MANVTVLKDENGLQREYNEAKRKARVGERIKVVNKVPYETRYENGDVLTVKKEHPVGIFAEKPFAGLFDHEYVVLEPTSTVIIDGVRYTEEKRKAAVGERILITKRDPDEVLYDNGDVFIVARLDYDGDVRVDGDYFDNAYVTDNEYVVLTPVAEPVAPASAPTPQVINVTIPAIHVTVHGNIEDVAKAVADGVKAQLAKLTEPGGFESVAREMMTHPKPKSPQELRDEIVERAKADVAELVAKSTFIYSADEWFTPNTDKATYVVNREKRTVVALIQRKHSGKVWAKGIAKCAPGDVFNAHIGRAIALRRALGLPVPDEYLNTPQPTGVRVGDRVRNWQGRNMIAVETHEEDTPDNALTIRYIKHRNYPVIDDSREEREVSAQ